MDNGHCDRCNSIETDPGRNWPPMHMNRTVASRDDSGAVIEVFECENCPATWRRRWNREARSIGWRLMA